MAKATGRRVAAAACAIIGGVTIIGIPIFWPLAYVFWKSAREAEQERELELRAISSLSEPSGSSYK